MGMGRARGAATQHEELPALARSPAGREAAGWGGQRAAREGVLVPFLIHVVPKL
jgi:hypothetical protein